MSDERIRIGDKVNVVTDTDTITGAWQGKKRGQCRVKTAKGSVAIDLSEVRSVERAKSTADRPAGRKRTRTTAATQGDAGQSTASA